MDQGIASPCEPQRGQDKPLLERGARATNTPAEAAAARDVVITMLTDARAVDARL